MRSHLCLPFLLGTSIAANCPFMGGELPKRDDAATSETAEDYLAQFRLDDTSAYLTTDWGTPINDQASLKAGSRGPTLLEDFTFRQKLQRFDHERIPERVVHARGAGAHGTFTSYGDFSNITASSFLAKEGKETPMFVRFSTVVGERGSIDTARDVRGMATRFYTDEGNFDIVGINLPVFFINDGILFPDMVHAFKPEPNKAIPQAATAHDTAYDFFSQQPSSLNIVTLIMSGYGLPRSYRHMNGFGVHTMRLVTDDGRTKLVKWHWKSMQGTASLLWEEAQAAGGKNADFQRQDIWDAIDNGVYPEWELGIQIMDEADQLKYGFDVMDPTKFVPEELVPITPLGKMTLNRNPTNYFAEVEQVGFQPGHVVRGIDFSEDPLLQGRLYSYLDTQMNRYGGPNFEQAPINRPRVAVHNNNRDGKAQAFIPTNNAAYSPNSLNNAQPAPANQTVGNGFFTAPNRKASGSLVREISSSFNDHWSQPRQVWNSLTAAEKQITVNSLRFEVSKVNSQVVRQNFINQLNMIDHDFAARVAQVLVDVTVPEPNPTFYNNKTAPSISIFQTKLPKIQGLNLGILASTTSNQSMTEAAILAQQFTDLGLFVSVVAETQQSGVNVTYSAADAISFDALVLAAGAESIFLGGKSPLYPIGRPLQILQDAYNYGKPVGASGNATAVFDAAGIKSGPGVYLGNGTEGVVEGVNEGLKTFKFLDRYPLDM